MDHLDPDIPRAPVGARIARPPPPLSETHLSLRGDPLLWSHRAVAPEDLPDLRSRWWDARLNQIWEAVQRSERFSKELRLARQKAEVELDLRAEWLRDVQIWQRRLEFEFGLMAEIIFTESTSEERARTPAPWRLQPLQLIKWALAEARTGNPLQQRCWACMLNKVTCLPSPPPNR